MTNFRQEKIDTLSTKVLYFYPNTLSEEKQYWILGIVETVACNFQSYKLDDNVTMVKFTKSKLALKKVANLYIVRKIFEHFFFLNLKGFEFIFLCT